MMTSISTCGNQHPMAESVVPVDPASVVHMTGHATGFSFSQTATVASLHRNQSTARLASSPEGWSWHRHSLSSSITL